MTYRLWRVLRLGVAELPIGDELEWDKFAEEEAEGAEGLADLRAVKIQDPTPVGRERRLLASGKTSSPL